MPFPHVNPNSLKMVVSMVGTMTYRDEEMLSQPFPEELKMQINPPRKWSMKRRDEAFFLIGVAVGAIGMACLVVMR